MCGRFYDIYDLGDITSHFRVSRPPALPFLIRAKIEELLKQTLPLSLRVNVQDRRHAQATISS